MRIARAIPAVLLSAAAGMASAQSQIPAVFVANNGNLEGSVTSYTFDPDGRPVKVDQFITDSRNSGEPTKGGENAYSIDISPSGEFLAVTHVTALSPFERLTILRVHPDATLSEEARYQVPNAAFSVKWLSDTRLAVTRTSTSFPNYLFTYEWDRPNDRLRQLGLVQLESFSTVKAIHPSRQWLYVNTTVLFQGGTLQTIFIDPSTGVPTIIDSLPLGPNYGLDPAISSDGRLLYVAGGSINDEIAGFIVDETTGMLFPAGFGFFQTPDRSPNQIGFGPDDGVIYVGHANGNIRSFLVDPTSGEIVDTGMTFDIGDVGDIQPFGEDLVLMLNKNDLNSPDMGLISMTYDPAGSFAGITGPAVPSGGRAPERMATWFVEAPDCPADLNGDGVVDADDFFLFLQLFADGDPRADFNNDGVIDADDFFDYLTAFAAGC
ncbi:MAG: beta-propeller fold lactonase family protein [Phycisphaerales bacterium]|nr:beta-propeller fold lactonase family protein [Phycisphaerales bacterium]